MLARLVGRSGVGWGAAEVILGGTGGTHPLGSTFFEFLSLTRGGLRACACTLSEEGIFAFVWRVNDGGKLWVPALSRHGLGGEAG